MKRMLVPVAPDAEGQGPVFSIRDLSLSYGGKAALRGVDLDIQRGRVTALVGPSGCGKTSFLSCLNRMTDLVPDCEVRGSITLDGREVVSRSLDVVALRRAVGMVFQKPNPFPLSIRANLHLPLREHGCRGRRRRDELSEQVLREVGLWDEVSDRLDQPAPSLSGGQQQRLCIARALTLRPRLLLMDEPCSSLDPMATETVEALIEEMRGAYSIVIVTHNLGQARRLANDMGVFWVRNGSGQLIESGTAADLFERPRDPATAAYLTGRKG